MTIAKKIENFMSQSSWIRKMFEDGIKLKKEYGAENVFDFSLGNPNVLPPSSFKKALAETVQKTKEHGYMPNAGYLETREAVASFLTKENNLKIPASNVVMTCGAGGALNVVFKSILNPDDEVITVAPFFVEYRFYVDNYNGVLKVASLKKDFSLDIAEIEKNITEKTKAILINSPNNPTGKVYSKSDLDELAFMLLKKQKELNQTIYLISDEPYNKIVYDNAIVPNIFEAYKNSIVVTSYSKTMSIPGERIGYIAVHPELSDAEKFVAALVFCNRILGFVNAPALMQRVVAKVQNQIVDVNEYKKKRDMLCEGLSKIGYEFNVPEGAFYLFPKAPIEDDVKFVQILQQEKVLTVPGSGFGTSGYFRIAYCVDDKTILNSIPHFKKAFNEALKLGG